MKRIITLLAVSLATIFGVAVLTQATAGAASSDILTNNVCTGSGSSSTFCQGTTQNTNPIYGPDSIVMRIVNILAIVIGVISVIFIIVGGINYMTSGGDPGKVSSAKSTILYALIGIVVAVVANSLIVFVLNRVG